MNVKRFLAETASEAMNQIRDELGRDAFILNQRTIRRKGLKGLFQKPMIEVVAAYEPKSELKEERRAEPNPMPSLTPPPRRDEKTLKTVNRSMAGALYKTTAEPQTVFSPEAIVDEEVFRPFTAGAPVERVAPIQPRRGEEKIATLETKIDSLTATVSALAGKIQVSRDGRSYQPEVEALLLPLLENDVHEEFAHKVAREVADILGKQDADPTEVMEQILKQYIGEPAPVRLKRFKRTVVMLVGATGVGKTTTLAKLAAIYQLNHHAKVGIIATDTYRIAAVDQLKTYAEILEIPLSIVYSPSEVAEALQEHEDKDIVLIDTAGKSPKDPTHVEEITELIKYSDCDEVHLVLSATTSFAGLLGIIQTYSFLRDYKILFTKMDENPTWGMLLNTKFLTEKPISYVAAGQNVPDDIEVMDARKIISRLIGREL